MWWIVALRRSPGFSLVLLTLENSGEALLFLRVSHLRPEEKLVRHKISSCRKGRHAYGDEQHIGGGILRRVCATCGFVSIDLTQAEAVSKPVGRSARRRSDG